MGFVLLGTKGSHLCLSILSSNTILVALPARTRVCTLRVSWSPVACGGKNIPVTSISFNSLPLQVNSVACPAIASPSEIPKKFKIYDQFGRGCSLVVTKVKVSSTYIRHLYKWLAAVSRPPSFYFDLQYYEFESTFQVRVSACGCLFNYSDPIACNRHVVCQRDIPLQSFIRWRRIRWVHNIWNIRLLCRIDPWYNMSRTLSWIQAWSVLPFPSTPFFDRSHLSIRRSSYQRSFPNSSSDLHFRGGPCDRTYNNNSICYLGIFCNSLLHPWPRGDVTDVVLLLGICIYSFYNCSYIFSCGIRIPFRLCQWDQKSSQMVQSRQDIRQWR